MTPVCPFTKASRPDDASSQRSGENQNKQQSGQESKSEQESGEPASSSPKCPFGYDSQTVEGQESRKPVSVPAKCPLGYDSQTVKGQESGEPVSIPAKCPLGFDSQTFKLGPLSCLVCKALLYECSKCVPCSHVYCKVCILHFKDCPLCGADIEKIEGNPDLQKVVDRFIEGHARIKRSRTSDNREEVEDEKKMVIYEDVSLERGAFLVQQAVRAFRANNIESAKSRLILCQEDIREQLEVSGTTSELCSQLGAVLGMLGDCCRATGDAGSAVTYFEESVNFLLKVPRDDPEITHTLSVSLNKIGDLKYYDGELQGARSFYLQALDVRRGAIKDGSSVPSQILDVAVSLAKVADLDRNLGNEVAAVDRFQEAINLLESLRLNSEEISLEQRRVSVLEFLNSQLAQNKPDSTQ